MIFYGVKIHSFQKQNFFKFIHLLKLEIHFYLQSKTTNFIKEKKITILAKNTDKTFRKNISA